MDTTVDEISCDPNFAEALAPRLRSLAAAAPPGVEPLLEILTNKSGISISRGVVEGKPLSQVILPGQLSTWGKFQLIEQVLEAMAAAHRHGVVHGLLSPEAVKVQNLQGGFGEAIITQFGQIAKGLPGLNWESALCAAPEFLSQQPAGPQIDLYAAGCLAYFVLSGQHAFGPPGGDWSQVVQRKLSGDEPPLAQVATDVAPKFSEWVRWLMQPQPAERPATFEQALEGFRALRSGTVEATPNKESTPLPDEPLHLRPKEQPVKKKPRAAIHHGVGGGGGLIMTVLALGALGFLLHQISKIAAMREQELPTQDGTSAEEESGSAPRVKTVVLERRQCWLDLERLSQRMNEAIVSASTTTGAQFNLRDLIRGGASKAAGAKETAAEDAVFTSLIGAALDLANHRTGPASSTTPDQVAFRAALAGDAATLDQAVGTAKFLADLKNDFPRLTFGVDTEWQDQQDLPTPIFSHPGDGWRSSPLLVFFRQPPVVWLYGRSGLYYPGRVDGIHESIPVLAWRDGRLAEAASTSSAWRGAELVFTGPQPCWRQIAGPGSGLTASHPALHLLSKASLALTHSPPDTGHLRETRSEATKSTRLNHPGPIHFVMVLRLTGQPGMHRLLRAEDRKGRVLRELRWTESSLDFLLTDTAVRRNYTFAFPRPEGFVLLSGGWSEAGFSFSLAMPKDGRYLPVEWALATSLPNVPFQLRLGVPPAASGTDPGWSGSGLEICEALVFDRQLSPSERVRMDAFLCRHYFAAKPSTAPATSGSGNEVRLQAQKPTVTQPQ